MRCADQPYTLSGTTTYNHRLDFVKVSPDEPPTTLLSGSLQDQGALNGVLTTLYALGFTLRSVTTA